MLDSLSTQNLDDDSDDGSLFDNYTPKKPTKEEKEKQEKEEKKIKALGLITNAKSKLIADLNIDVGGLAACSYNTADAFFNVESITGEKGDDQKDS